MNNDEMQLMTKLSEQLQSMSNNKDTQADACIQQLITPQPEALYKLVQLTLIQHIAIDQLKTQLQNQQTKPAPSEPKGFLDELKEKLFGTPSASSVSPASRPAVDSTPPAMNNSNNTTTAPSFLRQAMTVGAGVAGGLMLGNALESLFRPNDSASNSSFLQPDQPLNPQNDFNNFMDDNNNSDNNMGDNTNDMDSSDDETDNFGDDTSFDD